ncbi:WecB/TagA/CpsF family glycosyltransferase [Candidatus Chloroploca sp. M-50]|uniref:WecB/TagA/CpsF family glycosyltransferase n=1 Tax=Candidatus Chloroploca mongolica TaxID=2528176 RepID=A0ABS4D9P2_9CHLR|nr:WecB/TagA/CpsF family glycosyltransferase [Candidatus Chloroploca mongolica]MBP1466134.1 WecB/TagA/CpsF family glycosyltransferase [Candidatus Chloroploca mongolica]
MRKLLIVLGVPIDNLTMEEALVRCDEFIAQGRATGRTHQIATVNADFVVNSLQDPELRRILQEADMATADGMPLVWASRLLGGPLPGRVTGADMVPALAHRAAHKGYSVFLLGAGPGIADRAADILQQRNPGLKVAGVLSPPPASVLDMDQSIVDAIKAARPDILLVAFGNPKQEKWIRMHAPTLHVPICIGVGGTLDMIVGVTRRAPVWMQRAGLEWVYRLAQEPQRLLKRYLHDFGYFGYFFARQWWAMRSGGGISMVPVATTIEPPPPPPPPTEPVLVTADGDEASVTTPALFAAVATQTTPIMRIRGRLDVSNQATFMQQANQLLQSNPHLIISLAEAEFLDSSALGALVALANRARAEKGDVWLVEVPQPIREILTLVNLHHFFEIVATPAAAEDRRLKTGEMSEAQPVAGGWHIIRGPRLFDAASAATMLELCLKQLEQHPKLILDMSEVIFLASIGMSMLIKVDRAARERGGELRITNCSSDVLRTLKLVKLETILNLYPDLATATSAKL